MPSTSAEMSLSRMAVKARPTRVRNRLRAPISITTAQKAMSQAMRASVFSGMPKKSAGGTFTPRTPPVTESHSRKM